MVVFHGTDSISAESIKKDGIKLSSGEASVDNGKGFYMTPDYGFAVDRANYAAARKRMKGFSTAKPAVLKFEIEIDDENLNVKEFKGCSAEWQEFVLSNRLGADFWKKQTFEGYHNLDAKYDVVIDETADTGISNLTSGIREMETITEHDFRQIIKSIGISTKEIWGQQISLHTQKAIDSCILSCKEIKIV